MTQNKGRVKGPKTMDDDDDYEAEQEFTKPIVDDPVSRVAKAVKADPPASVSPVTETPAAVSPVAQEAVDEQAPAQPEVADSGEEYRTGSMRGVPVYGCPYCPLDYMRTNEAIRSHVLTTHRRAS